MTFNAKIYVSVLLALGFCVLASAFAQGSLVDTRFAAYFALSVFASILKVGMPAMAGSMSFNFLFVLIAILDLGMAQALFIGAAAILIEALWRPKARPSVLQILFGLATVALSIFCTDAAFHAEFLFQQGFNLAARLAVATTVFFIVNTFPACAVQSLSERAPLLPIWREQYFWSFPYYAVGGVLAYAFRMESIALGWETSLLTIPVAQLLYRTYTLYLARVEDSKVHAEEMAALHLRTIEALALAIEAKDDTTHEHLKRVQVYAIELGKELGLTAGELEALQAAAVLHDIGKLAVPEYIISKPGKLTPEEFEKMKVHPLVGSEILEQVQFPYPVVPIVRAHHEKWNGTGYPLGLRGNDIPIGARILSAVDALDALASDRQYRRALPLDEAMAKVEKESGSAFDPVVVAALKRKYVELEKKAQTQKASTTKLSTGVKIERGDAPAAGFETTRPALPRPNASSSSGDMLNVVMSARKDMQLLFDIGESPEHPLGFDEMMAILAVRLKRVAPVDAMALYLLREDKLVPEFVTGDNIRLFASLQIPMGQGLSGWVAENRKPIINGNPSVEPGYLNDPNVFSTLRSALAVPLEIEGTVIGVLAVYHEDRDAYTKDHLRLLEALAPKLAHSVEQTLRAGEAVAENAKFDVSTGLPKARALFVHLEAELARCRRLNIGLAVVVCSVEGIRKLNEKRGRLEGDRAIQGIAAALKAECREFEYIARMGANEFVLVLPGMRRDAMPGKAERLANLTGSMKGSEPVTVLVGQAFFPEDGSDAEQLIAEADRRMMELRQTRPVLPSPQPAHRQRWVQ